jgi:hypothetical protein
MPFVRRCVGLVPLRAQALALVCVALGAVVAASPAGAVTSCSTGPQAFSYTGAEQCYTVPAGISHVRITTVGGEGGGLVMSGNQPAQRANGARASAIVAVAPGDQLTVRVGGEGGKASGVTGAVGGYNGGGAGGNAVANGTFGGGNGGGGASDVLAQDGSPLLVAAGGGGQGGATGSSPGGDGGTNGGGGKSGWEVTPCDSFTEPRSGHITYTYAKAGLGGGGGGITPGGGGAGGVQANHGCAPTGNGLAGSAGSGAIGGRGANGVAFTGTPSTQGGSGAGGGGGGGYRAGGGGGSGGVGCCYGNVSSGGAGGGGGGGSSFAASGAQSVSFAVATTGTASVTITAIAAPGAPAGANATAQDGSANVTFTAPSDNGGDAVSGYTVTAVDETDAARGGQTTSGSASPLTVNGLTVGDMYHFDVRAVNAAGPGSAMSSSAVQVADTIAPTAAITSPADGATYVQGAAANAAYTCADSGSGIDTCAGDVANGARIDTATPGAHTFTVTATDRGGNPATETVHYTVAEASVLADSTAPTVTLTTPADGATYVQRAVVAAQFSCGDAALASCAGTVAHGAGIDTAALGSHAFTVVAADNAGNRTTRTVHYTVRAPRLTLGLRGHEAKSFSAVCRGLDASLRSCTATVRKGSMVVARGKVAAAGAAKLTVQVKLTKKGRRALNHARKVKVTVVAVTTTGVTVVHSASTKLRR